MIIIKQPSILQEGKYSKLRCFIEVNKEEQEVWFSVKKEYEKFLVDEQVDAFLVAILPYAMKLGEDIKIEGIVSERLFYTISNYLIKAISIAIPECKEIKIHYTKLNNNPLKTIGEVGTGYSAGVDSFSTIYDHLSDRCSENYIITKFAYLNVGSHGDNGGEEARKLFKERYKHIKPYLNEVGINSIQIDSNISDIIMMKFIDTCTFRNVAAILTVQKLFKTYYFSSSVRLDKYELKFSSERYDLLSLNMLSTETTQFFSTGSQYTRYEKTELITNYLPTYKYLNVCTREVENCSVCDKCMRTQLTLEIIGMLDKYSAVFNIKKYYKEKNKYIAKVMIKKKENSMYKEIYEKMKENNFKIPIRSYLMVFPLRIKKFLHNK